MGMKWGDSDLYKITSIFRNERLLTNILNNENENGHESESRVENDFFNIRRKKEIEM